jgi:Icc-related predicted phosphoesterase
LIVERSTSSLVGWWPDARIVCNSAPQRYRTESIHGPNDCFRHSLCRCHPPLPGHWVLDFGASIVKLQLVSDLHVEFAPVYVAVVADVVVAAGDIGARETALPVIDGWIEDGAEVVLVLGNHEFYGRDYDETIQQWRAWADERPRLHLLDRDAVILDGVRFLGATLWTDFGRSWRAMRIGERCMNDFHVIRYRGRRLTPEDTAHLHAVDVAWLEQMLAARHDGPTVVVTHHLPHPGSVARQYLGDELNPAFVSDLDHVIRAGRPALWCHGHTHTPCDHYQHGTRIVCNPGGYPGERYTAFDPALILEV